MDIAPFRIEKKNLRVGRKEVISQAITLENEIAPRVSMSRQVAESTKVAFYTVTSTAPKNTNPKSPPKKASPESFLGKLRAILQTEIMFPFLADVEDGEGKKKKDSSREQARRGIRSIAEELHRRKRSATASPELVIAVHGYNTRDTGVEAWYEDIFKYVAELDLQMRDRDNLVFVGYRWPSEKILNKPQELAANLRALPSIPRALFWIGAVLLMLEIGGFLTTLLRSLEIIGPTTLTKWLLAQYLGERGALNLTLEVLIAVLVKVAIGIVFALTMIVIALWLLRISVYFRDVYRAINFGVPDLTEFIRRLDHELIALEREDRERHYGKHYAVPIDPLNPDSKRNHPPGKRVRLNFLGHSMGGLVITNTVRVISDVFDQSSIQQNPTADVGNALRLSRLVLVAPDIPVLSVVSSRSNGLASSIRRFDEAYLFSNEGDLALRLASRAANYISFPSSHRNYGHRLGSIAIRDDIYDKGIINLEALTKHYVCPSHTAVSGKVSDEQVLDDNGAANLKKEALWKALTTDPYDILKCLYITHQSGKFNGGYQSLKNLYTDEHSGNLYATLADLFTFFDCTDYVDNRVQLISGAMNAQDLDKRKVGLLTRPARNKREYLKLQDYAAIAWDGWRHGLDSHSGYFKGAYARKLMYRLAFVGFEQMLQAIADEFAKDEPAADPLSTYQSLERLSEQCKEKGLQVYLSPLRYWVDVQKFDSIRNAKREMIDIVQPAVAPTSPLLPLTE